jgi:hypothetical protein
VGGGRDGLRKALEVRGVEVEFMPEGMGRRKMNQSGWNAKSVPLLKHMDNADEDNRNQTLHLTIQLTIPPHLLEGDTHDASRPRIHTRVLAVSSKPDEELPTLSSLLPTSTIPSLNLIFALPFHPTSNHPLPEAAAATGCRPYYPLLPPDQPLIDVLKGTAFVEFPSIEVLERDTWEERLKLGKITVVPVNITTGLGRGRDDGWGKRRRQDGGKDKDGVDVESVGPEKRVKLDIALSKVGAPMPMTNPSTLLGLIAYGSDNSDDEVDNGDL